MTAPTLPTCAVLCQVHSQDGQPEVGATVSARLTRFDGEAWRFVSPKPEQAVTAANGECTLHLWRNARGDTESQYLVKIRTTSGAALEMVATVPDTDSTNLRQISNLPAYPGRSPQQINIDAAIEAAVQAQGYAQEMAEALAAVQNMDALDPADVDGLQAFTFEDGNGVRHMGRISKTELAALIAPVLNSMVRAFDLTNPELVEDGVLFDMPAGFTEENFTLRTVTAGESDFVLIGDAVVRDGRIFVPGRNEHQVSGVRYVASGVKL